LKNKLRILYLVNIPSPYRVSFFNELGKICDLTVLFERKSSSDRELTWHEYDFEHFNGIFLNGVNFKSDQGLCLGIIKFLSRKKYDCIVIGGYSTPTGALAINYLKISNIPFVLNIDGGLIKGNESKIKKIIKTYYISSATAWLSTGNSSSKYLEYYGAIKEKIYVYPFTTLYNNEIAEFPLSQLEKVQLRNELGLSEGKTVVAVGQFIHRKGFDILIKAWSNVFQGASLYFIGGEPTSEYIDLTNSINTNNIHFIGFKSKHELQKYYRAADLFVLPTREDIWGLVINEALANGLPVITTDKCVAGLELIKNGENGFIVPVDNIEYLSMKINEVLSNEELISKMSTKSIETAQFYTIENMAEKTLEIVNRIIKDPVL